MKPVLSTGKVVVLVIFLSVMFSALTLTIVLDRFPGFPGFTGIVKSASNRVENPEKPDFHPDEIWSSQRADELATLEQLKRFQRGLEQVRLTPGLASSPWGRLMGEEIGRNYPPPPVTKTPQEPAKMTPTMTLNVNGAQVNVFGNASVDVDVSSGVTVITVKYAPIRPGINVTGYNP